MTRRGREEASGHPREDEGPRDALEHVLGAGLESEIAAARSALEEARGLLEGALRRTEGVLEDAAGGDPGVEGASASP